jgi:ppGpp synthetase/RelA/SpoT-type nucleotidyltranferase
MIDGIDKLLKQAPMVERLIYSAFEIQIEKEMPNSYVKILSRIKSPESIAAKIQKKREQAPNCKYDVASLTDIIGFRLVCHFQTDIEKTVRMLASMIKEKNVFKALHEPARLYTTAAPIQSVLRTVVDSIFRSQGLDFESQDKDSRYTSLHITCTLMQVEFPPIEIQVRNVFEDAWSSIEHASKYKGRAVSNTVTRHLTVLATLIQSCVEYTEAIRADMEDGGVDQSGTVKPLITYQDDLAQFPHSVKQLFGWIMEMREGDKHREILERIAEVRREDDGTVLGNQELLYFLEMEEALSQLKLNNLAAAQSLYEAIGPKYPRRAMVPYRLSDVFKLKNEFSEALEYLRKSESLLAADQVGSSRTEQSWIKTWLPLKKAYFLWRTGDVNSAYSELSEAYEAFPKSVDQEIARKYFSSVIYYALESEKAVAKINPARFELYVQQMRTFGMDSIETALPEEVDTYAWVCHHLGIEKEAERAILEVLSCVHSKGAPSNVAMFDHKGKQWAISTQDLSSLHEHLREILTPPRGNSPVSG